MELNPFGKLPSRTKVFEKIQEMFPDMHFSVERAVLDPILGNRIMEEANFYLTSRPKPASSDAVRKYGVTLTTRVVNGVPFKQALEYKETLDRIMGLAGVFKIVGNFELTKQKALHVHCIVSVMLPHYLDKGKVERANLKEFVKVELLKTDRKLSQTETYCRKEEDDLECLELLCPIFSSTRFHLPDPHPPPSSVPMLKEGKKGGPPGVLFSPLNGDGEKADAIRPKPTVTIKKKNIIDIYAPKTYSPPSPES